MLIHNFASKLISQLEKAQKRVEEECSHISLTLNSLVALSDAFQMELATELQSGPLAHLHRQVVDIHTIPTVSDLLRNLKQQISSDVPNLGVSADSPLSPSSDDVISDPWSRKMLLTFGM